MRKNAQAGRKSKESRQLEYFAHQGKRASNRISALPSESTSSLLRSLPLQSRKQQQKPHHSLDLLFLKKGREASKITRNDHDCNGCDEEEDEDGEDESEDEQSVYGEEILEDWDDTASAYKDQIHHETHQLFSQKQDTYSEHHSYDQDSTVVISEEIIDNNVEEEEEIVQYTSGEMFGGISRDLDLKYVDFPLCSQEEEEIIALDLDDKNACNAQVMNISPNGQTHNSNLSLSPRKKREDTASGKARHNHSVQDYLAFLDCDKEDDDEQRRELDEVFEWQSIDRQSQSSQQSHTRSVLSTHNDGVSGAGNSQLSQSRHHTESEYLSSAIHTAHSSLRMSSTSSSSDTSSYRGTRHTNSPLPYHQHHHHQYHIEASPNPVTKLPNLHSRALTAYSDQSEEDKYTSLMHRYQRLKRKALEYKRTTERLRRERDEARRHAVSLQKKISMFHHFKK